MRIRFVARKNILETNQENGAILKYPGPARAKRKRYRRYSDFGPDRCGRRNERFFFYAIEYRCNGVARYRRQSRYWKYPRVARTQRSKSIIIIIIIRIIDVYMINIIENRHLFETRQKRLEIKL